MNEIIEDIEWGGSLPLSEDFLPSPGRSGELIFSQPGTRNSSHIAVERDAVRRRFANDAEAHEASAMLLQAVGLMPAQDVTLALAKREIRRKRYYLEPSRQR